MHNLISLDSNSNTKSPSHIDTHHYKEWADSGVSHSIIHQNVKSYHDAFEVDKLLNRNNKSRWKHSDNLVPCWAVRGIDPLTDEPTLLGIQVKPDTPILNKDGKYQKYLGARDYASAPVFLDTGIEKYWKAIIDDKEEPVFIGEGAKKAGAALSIGHAMISIPGVSTCRKKGRLHPYLNLFVGFGRVFYLAFDNDVMSKKPVQTALLAMGRELSATGSKVMVVCLPPGELKGVDDFIAAKGEQAFNDLVSEALTIEEWHEQVKETWREQLEEIKSNKRSRVARYMEIIKLGWGHELKYNELKNSIELSDKPLDLDQARLQIALEFDLDVPMQDAIPIIENLARQNSYHPVAEYLDALARQYPQPDLSILDNLASRYFGTDEPLHNLYMRKTLISAVARVKEPGCQHDEATILVGGQGIGKSSFWGKLFGSDWFTDGIGDANEKDELMKLHLFWGLEWSEFESVYKRKEANALKKFMTSRIDPIRAPYSRSHKDYARRSVLVGTTNEQEILIDPTGSRRFWIIPVSKRIPLNLLEEERDQIWAAAYALYRSGEQWHLTWADYGEQEEKNKDYQSQDPWHEMIQGYIHGQPYVTVSQIFHELSIEPARQDMGLTKRISAVLRSLGWEKIRKFLNGHWVHMWQELKTKVGFGGGSRGSYSNDAADNTYQEDSSSQDDPRDPPKKPTFDNFDNATRGAVSDPSLTSTETLCPRTGLPLPKPFEIKIASPLGISTCLVTAQKVRKKDGRTESRFEFEFANGTASRKFASVAKKAEAEEIATKEINARILEALKHPSRSYSVQQIVGGVYESEVVWIENCKCVDIPDVQLHRSQWVFETPAGDRIHVGGEDEFKLEVGT